MPPNLLRETRQLAADLIGAKMKEIALVGPTSLGLSFIAQGLNWQPGDKYLKSSLDMQAIKSNDWLSAAIVDRVDG